jgi:hypothetical protein
MTVFSDLRKITAADPDTFESATDSSRRRAWKWIVPIVMVLILVVFVFLKEGGRIGNDVLLGYLAFLIGWIVGAGELIARYRDAPFGALGRTAGLLYQAINGLAAATAFFLINTFGWTFDFATENPTASDAIQVLVAGFGAMALFRSSLFIARIGDQEVGIGPAIVLQTVLNAADAGVDRESAKGRAPTVQRIMRSVDAYKAKDVLPEFCYRLLQSSLPEGEYNVVVSKVEAIFGKEGKVIAAGPDGERVIEVAESSKAYLLGLIIMNYMGADVLEVAVNTLGSEIQKPPPRLHLADVTKEIEDSEGEEVAVDYQVTAEDAKGNPIQPHCNPQTGSKFPVGQTTIVSCEATDDDTGITAKGTFKVTLTRKKPELGGDRAALSKAAGEVSR